MSNNELAYQQYDIEYEEYEKLINESILPSRKLVLFDNLRNYDICWELDYENEWNHLYDCIEKAAK